MTDDDVTVPVPGATLHNFLRDYDRLQSLTMLAASHADARLTDIKRLRCLVCLAARPDANEMRVEVLTMLEQVVERLEAHARDDATLPLTALRDHEQQSWPFPALDPLAPPVRH
jgi:hypothetical protein